MERKIGELYISSTESISDMFTKEELIRNVKMEMLDIRENIPMLLDCPHILLNDKKRFIVYYVEKAVGEHYAKQYYLTHKIVKDWTLNMMEIEKIAFNNMKR